MTPTVAEMVRAGRLEAVPVDLATAASRLSRAEQHLATATALLGQDNEVAYGSLYDAARKAITAHMLAHGLRAPARPGAHETVGLYASERVPDPTGSVAQFQRMRRRRNKSEYDDMVVGTQDVPGRPAARPRHRGRGPRLDPARSLRRHTMTTRTEAEIDQRLAETAAEYVGEEQAAAEEEAQEATASAVFSVRLSPATHEAVRAAATRAHLTPSALIRQWVTKRVEEPDDGDIATAVAALRRDAER